MKRSSPSKRIEREVQMDRSRCYADYIKGVTNSSKESFNKPAYAGMNNYNIIKNEIHKTKIVGDLI